MITKFSSIKKYAVFKDFRWDESVRAGGSVVEFGKLNIIYGRNYSGKTTLSRIIQCFELNRLHEKYPTSEFILESSEAGVTMNHANLTHPYSIRVFNKDFIKENLSWLIDEEKEIKPFTTVTLGSDNNAILTKISDIEERLGIEDTIGLRYEYKQKRDEYGRKMSAFSNAERETENILRQKAVAIKNDATNYNKVTYNIASIQADITTLASSPRAILTDIETDNLKLSLRETPKEAISEIRAIELGYNSLLSETNNIITKVIQPSEAIQELLNNSILQEWAKRGIELHKGKERRCGFCGSPLNENVWERLGAHFNQESENLDAEINALLQKIDGEKHYVSSFAIIGKESLYSDFHSSFEALQTSWSEINDTYIKALDDLKSKLLTRQADIFNPQLAVVSVGDLDFQGHIKQFNTLISKNSDATNSLKGRQDKARETLRLDCVNRFMADVDLPAKEKNVAKLREEADRLLKEQEALVNSIRVLETEIVTEKQKLQNEKSAADKINEYLNHYFGHNAINLEPITEDGLCRFIVKRDGNVAYNLSEGEASLVAFCYFMAKLDEPSLLKEKLIVWIDDPISNLDSNHIFFVFSLIENVIAAPLPRTNNNDPKMYKYLQLFISTHNLDFLKYLKRLSGADVNKKTVRFFCINRNDSGSHIGCMPLYLQKSITEFNYLFHQIYKCATTDSEDSHEVFYAFGNNLRKFLEVYLYYRYPDNRTLIEKIQVFFKDDAISTHVANRTSNEYSHLEEIFDRSMKPIDVPEIPRLAKYVLQKIEEQDKEQYSALVASIS